MTILFILKCDPKHILPNVQSVVRKPKFIMGHIYAKVQDLPILGKTARLHITAHEYVCNNESCSKVTFVEDFDGFLSYYGRMTERCADFICMLAMEASCEGCAVSVEQ